MDDPSANHEYLLVQGKQYRILRQIGEGAFSTVLLCVPERDPNGPRVAIKRATIPEKEISKAHDEFALVEFIGSHPNLVDYKGFEVARANSQYTAVHVMTHYPMSVISDMLTCQKKGIQFSTEHILNVMSSVVAAIQHMHSLSPPVTHRDIKPENILRSESGRYVLCDFGSATTTAHCCITKKELSVATDDIEANTTMIYRAPEMIELWRKQRVDQKTDVWALGVLLYYLMYFRFPFDETSVAIVTAKLHFPEKPYYPDSMKQLVRMCLTVDPKQRASIFDLAAVMCSYDELGVDPEVLTPVPDPGHEQGVFMSADHASVVQKAEADAAAVSAAIPASSTVPSSHHGGGAPTSSPPPPPTAANGGAGADLFNQLDWNDDSNTPSSTTVQPQPPQSTAAGSSAPATSTCPSETTTRKSQAQMDDLFSLPSALQPQSSGVPSRPSSAAATATTMVDLFGEESGAKIPTSAPVQGLPVPPAPTEPSVGGGCGGGVDLFAAAWATSTSSSTSSAAPVAPRPTPATSTSGGNGPDLFGVAFGAPAASAGGGASLGGGGGTGPVFSSSTTPPMPRSTTTTPTPAAATTSSYDGGLGDILSGFDHSKMGSTSGR